MKDKVLNLQLRQEEASDFPAVYNLHSSAFARKEEARLTDRVRTSNAFIPELSLVAIIEQKVVGHIMFSKIVIDNNGKEVDSLMLAPVSVIPEMQKLGIGSKLVNFGMEKAKTLGYNSVIVLGHDRYFSRFGFMPASRWHIKAPFNVPANTFMGVELVANSLADVSGTVRLAEEFQQI